MSAPTKYTARAAPDGGRSCPVRRKTSGSNGSGAMPVLRPSSFVTPPHGTKAGGGLTVRLCLPGTCPAIRHAPLLVLPSLSMKSSQRTLSCHAQAAVAAKASAKVRTLSLTAKLFRHFFQKGKKNFVIVYKTQATHYIIYTRARSTT